MRLKIALAILACIMVVPVARAENACIRQELGLPLAGPGAVDCGIAHAGQSRERARVAKCARKAIARGMPVRFGVGEMGIDAFTCDVAVMDSNKTFWLVTFDWDLSVSTVPSAFVGRCANIDPEWKDPNGEDHFGPRDCTADPDAFKRAEIGRP